MIIYLTEDKLNNYIANQVRSILKESEPDDWDYDTPESMLDAEEEFNEHGFADDLFDRYPDMEFDIRVSNDGSVMVIDMKSGEYYTGQAKIDYEICGTGRPCPNDYDREEEKIYPYYDFTDCFRTIMKKIDNHQPDGN